MNIRQIVLDYWEMQLCKLCLIFEYDILSSNCFQITLLIMKNVLRIILLIMKNNFFVTGEK